MLLSVCRSWAAWCKLNNRKWFPQNLKMFAIIFYIFRRAVWQ
ncbi:GST-loxP-cre recombinase fusion protein (plasmid) [Escherichia coli]|nr:GST-loxP-cre recombinase fusion protein [Escherichia coli]